MEITLTLQPSEEVNISCPSNIVFRSAGPPAVIQRAEPSTFSVASYEPRMCHSSAWHLKKKEPHIRGYDIFMVSVKNNWPVFVQATSPYLAVQLAQARGLKALDAVLYPDDVYTSTNL